MLLKFGCFWVIGLGCLLVGCGQKAGSSTVSGASSIPPSSPDVPAQSDPGAKPVASSLPAGTPIGISLTEVLDSETHYTQPFLIASTAADVKDPKGALAIPANSHALLVIRDIEKKAGISRIVLGLNRVDSAGKTFKTADGTKDMAVLALEDDSAKGIGHRSVHLEKNSLITFKLESEVQLR